MKNNSTSTSTRASVFLKHIISVFWSIAKAKSIALRNKTEAMKCRLTVLSLLKNKKFSLGSVSHKIQAIMGQLQHHKKEQEEEQEEEDQSRAMVLYNASAPSSSIHTQMEEEEEFEDQEKYPDLRHTLFEEEDDDLDLGDPNGSAIDVVRNRKELGGQEDFKLEDEIDQVADLFILKFHKRMRLQKLESFKRYQEMLQRSL